MQSFDFKKFLPHILIIVGFALFTLFYCYPQMQGMELRQGDNVSWRAGSKEAMDWHEKTGENTLWSNSMFGGMPTYTSYIPESNNYVVKITHVIINGLGRPASYLFIALLGCYILMQVLGINRWLSIVGALAYAFSSYNIVILAAGHETKLLAIGLMPAVIGGLLLVYRSKWLTGLPLLAISFSLFVQSGHYQIIYYFLIILFFMVIGIFVIALKEGKIKEFIIASFVSLAVCVVSVGPSLQVLMTTLEYNKETMRGGESEITINKTEVKKSGGLDKEYAFRWSNGIGETFCLIVPKLYGGSSSEPLSENSATYEKMTSMGVPQDAADQMMQNMPLYWGPQPFLSGPVYFGAIICFLFALGLMVIRSPHKWWILAACIISIVMSWGRHFEGLNYFLFDTLPMLNKFRTPSMVLVIAQLLFPVLGIWAVNDIVKGKVTGEELWKHVKLSAIITGGLCLLLAFGGSMFFDFKSPVTDAQMAQRYGQAFGNQQAGQQIVNALQEDRSDMAMKSALTSAVYIALAAGLLWAYSRKKIQAPMLIGGLGLLIAIDLISVDRAYLNEDNYVEKSDFEAQFEPRPVDQQILQDKGYYRVLDLTTDPYNDATGAAFHKMIGGYSPAKMERYQDMIDVHMSKGFNAQVLNMLNTKYLIVDNGGQPAAMPNPDALGNGWFVNEVKWANTADEEILSLKASNLGDTAQVANSFDPRRTAVVRNTFKDQLKNASFAKDSAAVVMLDKYGLNEISYRSKNSANGLAVFSDIYYPYGWTAYVDGKETPILKANYILRAIEIPAGEHKIEFKFHPKSFYTGDMIALITSILILGGAIFLLYLALKRSKEGAAVNG